jgi:hypothetical protein
LSGGRGGLDFKTCFSRVSSFRVSFSEVVAVVSSRSEFAVA